ncbi:hypothetical protein BJX66DRAFT_339811 [Aspergillus keveii]|uniref:Uncharacterized protein n=1 Tax=Aspergillus keveii TaxID=714993 RepID=A0ABR4G0V9_9EURO
MSNTTTVSIKDLPKLDLLHALWQNSPPALFYEVRNIPPPSWDAEEAEDVALSHNWDVDYIVGRVIKADLSGDEVDPQLYDRGNGKGAFAEVVRNLREQRQAEEDVETETRPETEKTREQGQVGEDVEAEAPPETEGGNDEPEHSEKTLDELDAIIVTMAKANIEEKIRESGYMEDSEGKETKTTQEQSV